MSHLSEPHAETTPPTPEKTITPVSFLDRWQMSNTNLHIVTCNPVCANVDGLNYAKSASRST
ncbi:MAG TPA: hypothetical protein VFA90_20215 [Terriglobales bacterium]|nr:hypothetical protein [Terriglobales bacterium]